jgi:hypothetical protein
MGKNLLFEPRVLPGAGTRRHNTGSLRTQTLTEPAHRPMNLNHQTAGENGEAFRVQGFKNNSRSGLARSTPGLEP